jgi:hypothetical protein
VIKKNLMKYYISIDLILNKLKTPKFYQEEDFRVVIWRAESKKSVPECARGVPGRARRVDNFNKITAINIKRRPF